MIEKRKVSFPNLTVSLCSKSLIMSMVILASYSISLQLHVVFQKGVKKVVPVFFINWFSNQIIISLLKMV